MKKPKAKTILIEIAKIITLYVAFFILAYAVFYTAFICAFDPHLHTAFQFAACYLHLSPYIGFVIIFGFPIIPLAAYFLLRIKKGCSWKKTIITSLIVVAIAILSAIITGLAFY